MKMSTGKVSAVVAAAALAAGGYALGTQGGGGAVAANSTSPNASGPPGPCGPDRDQFVRTLASKLGVSESKLRAALDKVRPSNGPGGDRGKGPGGRESAEAQALATALGVDVAKARDAARKAEDAEHAAGRRGPNENIDAQAASIAQSLNVDVAKVKAALSKIEADHRARHDQARMRHAAALAKALGLPTKKVSDALASLPHPGPGGPGRGGPPPGGPPPGGPPPGDPPPGGPPPPGR